jgi:predicted phage tail protein
MKIIRLHGDLAEKFGREFQLDVRSPAEAVRALCVLLPQFRQYWRDNAQRRYQVFVGGRNVATPDGARLREACSDMEVIRIAPLLAGASSNLRFVVGAIIAVVGYTIGQAYGGSVWGQVGVAMMGVGVSMAAGAVVEMLSPQQKGETQESSAANRPSYNFNGAVNTIAQGHPVPVCYGRMRVGSAVISAALETV